MKKDKVFAAERTESSRFGVRERERRKDYRLPAYGGNGFYSVTSYGVALRYRLRQMSVCFLVVYKRVFRPKRYAFLFFYIPK